MRRTLYTKDNKGKIRIWSVEQVDGKYRVIAGVKDGKLVTSKWTVVKGKNKGRANATTATEQAEAEALALYTKKKDKGYAEREEDIPDLMEVMLAHNYNDYKSSIVWPVYSQPKFDGIRCFVTKDGMFTRNRKPITAVPFIIESLKSVFVTNPDLIIDGELYSEQLKDNFNEIVSLVRKKEATAENQERAKQLGLGLYVFDIIPSRTSTMVFSSRFSLAVTILRGVQHVHMAQTDTVHDQKKLDDLYATYRNAGYEGQMIRADTAYQFERTAALLKRKEFIDAEFEITGYEEGVGNRSNTIGKFHMKMDSGVTFESNVKGDMKLLRQIWKDREKYIGTKATVKFFSYLPSGRPRFPYIIKFDRSYE